MITMQLFFIWSKIDICLNGYHIYLYISLQASKNPLARSYLRVRLCELIFHHACPSNKKFAKANNSVLYGLKLFTFEFDSNPVVIYTCWVVELLFNQILYKGHPITLKAHQIEYCIHKIGNSV